MPRFHRDRAKGHSDIAGYAPAQMDRTEGASHVTDRFPLGDGDVGAEAGAIIVAMGALVETAGDADDEEKKQWG